MRKGYVPIESYAAIGNGRTIALVADDGSVDWCCWPRFDSPWLFGRLLDAAGGGFFSLRAPRERSRARAYAAGTNVLVTTVRTDEGALRVTDFMPPGESCLVRAAECLGGSVRVEAHVRARPLVPEDPRRLRCGATVVEGPAPWRPTGDSWTSPLALEKGERAVWTVGGGAAPDALARTLEHWSSWSSRIEYRGPYAELVARSALALRLMVYEPTGAIVAAPTTSLPEEIGGVRNWDYRYAWLRDSALVLDAFMRLGLHDEAMRFWDWLGRLDLGSEAAAIVYAVDGTACPDERTCDDVDGYRGSRPVRTGNEAARQVQHDAMGYVLDAAYLCQVLMREPHARLAPQLQRAADRTARCWRQPGNGLWEMRGRPQAFLHSRVLSWVALDRALRLADLGWLDGDASSWRSERAALAKTILEEGFDRRTGAFVQALGGSGIDASALLIPILGLLPAADPRVRSTLDVVSRDLGAGDLLYRYRDDGLPGREGAFVLCSFWRVEALARAGRLEEAGTLFARLAARANDVGLLSEEVDPASGAFLGNFPQAFSHVGLIRAALALEEAEAGGPAV